LVILHKIEAKVVVAVTEKKFEFPAEIRELDNQMQQALKQNSMHQQLLQHMIEQQDLEIYDLMLQVCNIYSFY
jgi:hypothetical protein